MVGELVYVAEDEAPTRELLEQGLRRAGYEVEAMADGRALLDRVAKEPPGLILLDIALPELSGWLVQNRLSEDPETREIPVIAVTGHGKPGVEDSARDVLGFHDYIRKPFELDDLVARVEAALQDDPEAQGTPEDSEDLS